MGKPGILEDLTTALRFQGKKPTKFLRMVLKLAIGARPIQPAA
jgi:hypothetical protein